MEECGEGPDSTLNVPRKHQKALVIHVLTSLHFGGVERRMEILAESRESGTMEHLFCTIGGGGAAENRLISLGAKVIVLGLRTKIPNLLAIERLFRLFRKTQPVAVHTHGAEANFHGLIAARLAGVSVRIGEELAFQPIVERLALFFDIFTGLRTGW